MGTSLIHNMLFREVLLGVVVLLVLISFYVRYRSAAHRQYVRTRERRMALVVRSARRQLVAALVLLAAVLVYDRVLPHFGMGAQAQATAASSSVVKQAPKQTQKKRLKNAKSVSKQAASVSASASLAAASSAKASSTQAASSAQAASAASASSAAAKAQAAASASKAAQAAKVDPKAKAVAAVQTYYANHPEQQDTRIDNVGVIQYGSDYTGVPAYEVGLYQTQVDGSSVAVHMYFYYLNGTISRAY